ncbi:hypothetical protein OZX69_08465 [Lactobacillus sp. ESL0731]|uniref:Panacea domain-containing protein n=1 Tax=unclassified Lactobacillus TaxID=2620435 RepID=UPI0023F97BCB|nr:MULTISPECIES: hypothetical protein [unclassified Lactobacillus]WEV50967.1 hypothetical protein OZX63_08460 [Lactobacillus sp. ESL0700]WEV62098.1 hypothetical protein OZX69_08465 [Lactobacillus sp. ESL0731]
MTMMDLANQILYVADQRDLLVTNLQLQKVMYFVLKDAIRNDLLSQEVIGKTYDEPFQVWKYGPVVRSIYVQYSVYSSDPIIEDGVDTSELDPLNDDILKRLHENPFKLVNESHEEPFWQKNKDKIYRWTSNIPYSLEDVAVK